MTKYEVRWTDNAKCANRGMGDVRDYVETFTIDSADDKDALLNALQTILDVCEEDGVSTEWDQEFIDRFRSEEYDFEDVESSVFEMDPGMGYPLLLWIKQCDRVVYDGGFDEDEFEDFEDEFED